MLLSWARQSTFMKVKHLLFFTEVSGLICNLFVESSLHTRQQCEDFWPPSEQPSSDS